jgi:hypothetical protein
MALDLQMLLRWRSQSYSGRWETFRPQPDAHAYPARYAYEFDRIVMALLRQNFELRKALDDQTFFFEKMQGEFEPTMAEQVAKRVADAARAMEGVERAFVSHDGNRFLLTGPRWSEELSHAAATLAVSLSRELGNGKTWIRGGFRDLPAGSSAPDMECIFARR